MGWFRSLWARFRRRPITAEAEESPVVEPERTVALGEAPRARTRPRTSEDTSLPMFRASAMDRPTASGSGSALSSARLALNHVFTPAQPVTERKRFAGRLETLVQLISALEDKRGHVVLYGERGIGKTSLLHVLSEIARDSRYHVAYASCGGSTRFDEIFRTILAEVPLIYSSSVDPAAHDLVAGATLDTLLPQETFDARLLGDVCASITGTRLLIILDEYDRTEDLVFRHNVAELIKNLSDRAARVQLVIAGVAGNLQELVGYIPSIRRNVIGLPVPRLERREIEALIALGEREAGLTFTPAAVDRVDQLCNGSPYLVRLLCHQAGLTALNAGRLDVDLPDIGRGLTDIVRDAEQRLGPLARSQAEALFAAPQTSLLTAIAKAASTPDGRFGLHDVRAALTEPLADSLIPAELTRLEGLSLLTRLEGPNGDVVRFSDEALPFFIWMRLARDEFGGGTTRQAA